MDGFKIGTLQVPGAPLRGRFRGSCNDLVDAFEIGRATERERLQLLLQTRRSLLTSNGGSGRAVAEIDTMLGMMDQPTAIDERLTTLAQQFNIPRHQVIARAIGAA
ncbi:MAG TPA: hypothetical protein DEP24_05020 [Mycobacterium sp.]|nr:hypothetical protein [Mycobacterium sp.]